MSNGRAIVAEFYKDSGGRVTLFSLTALEYKVRRHDGKSYLHRDMYDVEHSRKYGYIYHMSGAGGGMEVEVSGIYFVSGEVKIKEKPCQLVSPTDKPPWRSKKTRIIRERNRTRRLRKLPKAFQHEPATDLLQWLETYAIDEEAVYCSICRDYMPGGELCKHCWWCKEIGWYSNPDERCKCKNRQICDVASEP